jgi:hypothetical protein
VGGTSIPAEIKADPALDKNLADLEQKLTQLLTDDEVGIKERILGIVGVSTRNTFFSQNSKFLESIDIVASILFADVDGDGKLTVKDLKQTADQVGQDLKNSLTSLEGILLMDHQKVGVRLLENIIFLIQNSQGGLHHDNNMLELTIFQLLVWGLLSELPKKYNVEITDDVAKLLIKILINLFKMYQQSDAIKNAANKIQQFVKPDGILAKLCSCLGSVNNLDGATIVKSKLMDSVTAAKIEQAQKNELESLRKKINELEQKHSI